MDSEGKRVAIYARVSSQEQVTEGVSIETQAAALKAYAKGQGWEIYDEYIDGGYSGGTDNRPELIRLLNDADQRRFDIIAVCKLDRFFRNLRLLLNHLHNLEQLGIKFISTQEGLDTSTPYGKFAVQIMGVIAEFERGRIGERVRDGKQYRLAQGRWPGGRTVYGYRWFPKEGKWEINEQEAEMVRYIYSLYLKEGLGMMNIISRLNQEGRRMRFWYTWHFHTIHRILSHPAYKGMHPKGILMPPIIDQDMWEAAQEKRQGARSMRRNPKNWLLQGLCVCGECGHVLGCQQKHAKDRRYYSCQGRDKDMHLDGSPKCTLPRIKADILEKAVWRRLKAVMTDHEALRDSLRNSLDDLKKSKTNLNHGWDNNEKELKAVHEKKERLGLIFADLAITKEQYEKKMAILKKKESELLKARVNLDPGVKADLDEIEKVIASLENTIAGKSGKLLLTELGIWLDKMPDAMETWIVNSIPTVDSWDDPNALHDTGLLQIGKYGPEFSVVEGPAQWNVEVSKETLWRNIRSFLKWLGIKVYVFSDRAEVRGFIPTEVIDYSDVWDISKRAAIIPSASPRKGGQGDRLPNNLS
ncbi:recombinase family protein [Chloroflexota bacterium]